MKFIRDFDKFRRLKINEALESGQFLAYHRTRLVEQSYIVRFDPDPNVNFYLQFAERGINKNEKNYEQKLNDNIKLLVDMNPHIKLDERGFPIVKKGDNITTEDPRIISQGFRAGAGDFYGVGLYTCYEFDDQIRDFNGDGRPDMSGYGQNIVEFRVDNTGKFLILDMIGQYNQAKKVWGPKHSLIDQLKKIMGGKFLNFYNKNKELLDGFNEILLKEKVTLQNGEVKQLEKDAQGRFLTAPIVLKLCRMEGFISLVDGISFTGQNDGRVLIVYEPDLAKPTRYTSDDGKTWNPMAKLEYQYERVRVGNKEILQCKIIDNDKELLQADPNRPDSVRWINSLDLPEILKDKKKFYTLFSRIKLTEQDSQNYFDELIKNLSGSKPQVIDNIIKRIVDLPIKTELKEEDNINYVVNLAIFLTGFIDRSGHKSDMVDKKLKDLFDYVSQIPSDSHIPIKSLVKLINCSKKFNYQNFDKNYTQNKLQNIILSSDSLYSNSIIYSDRTFCQMLDDLKEFSKDIASSKVNEAIVKLISDLDQVTGHVKVLSPNKLFDNSRVSISSFTKVMLLIGSNFDYLTEKFGNDFCRILNKYMNGFHAYYNHLYASNWLKYSPKLTASSLYFLPMFNSSGYSTWSVVIESENILIRLIEISSGLNYKSIDAIADCVILYLLTIKDDEIVVDREKVIGQVYISKKIQGTRIFSNIQNKLLKLKNGEDVEISGVKANFDFKKVYDELSKYMKIEDDFDKDLDYTEIADKIFKSMYGFRVKEEELLNQFDKLRNNTDFNKVKSAFGRRKGVIGKEYDLDYWIKDELKQKDLDKLNDLLTEKGIKYQF